MIREPVTFCPGCGGKPHDPAPPDAYVDFKGHRYREPFRCLCCGKEICYKQFCWGRTCGYCDTGRCQLGLVVKRGVDEKVKNFQPLGPGDMETIYMEGHGRKDIIEAAERILAKVPEEL